MSKFTLDDVQLKAWGAVHAKFPGYGKRWELIAEYARDQDGLVLAYWRLHRGPLFGERTLYSTEACARELGVAMSDLEAIAKRTGRWVEPRLRTDPAYQALKRLSRDERLAILRADHAGGQVP